MAPAEAIRNPARTPGAPGKMHFKREAESELRWVCDKDAQHK